MALYKGKLMVIHMPPQDQVKLESETSEELLVEIALNYKQKKIC